MQLTLLGTGAAEAVPDPFCRCRVCETARREGGRHVRARATALVNDDLLIDLGPDVLTSLNAVRAYVGGIKGLLITHRHSDHWHPDNLYWRKPGFTPTEMAALTVFGPGDALGDITPELAASARFSWQVVEAGDRWTLGAYAITAIPATHGGGHLEPLLYVIESEGRRLFYATDTAPLQEAAWELLRPLAPMNAIVMDSTTGEKPGGDGHHSFEAFLETRTRMVDEGLLVPGETTMVAHHFSHNGGLTYDELVDFYAPHDVTVAYDGLVLEV